MGARSIYHFRAIMRIMRDRAHLQGGGAAPVVEQILGAHQDQRLGEGPVHLAAQDMEQLRTRQDIVSGLHTICHQ